MAFFTGQPSKDPNHPDYVPTKFTSRDDCASVQKLKRYVYCHEVITVYLIYLLCDILLCSQFTLVLILIQFILWRRIVSLVQEKIIINTRNSSFF